MDPRVPVEESVGALVELVKRGLIRAIGICNVDLDQLKRAMAVAPIASVQNRCNVMAPDDGDLVVTPAQLALGWLLHRSATLIPIPGTGSIAHLEENAAAADIALSDSEYQSLSAIAAAPSS